VAPLTSSLPFSAIQCLTTLNILSKYIFRDLILKLQSNNEKLKLQISEMTTSSSSEMLSPPKKYITITNEVARTSVKIYKPYPITVSRVNDFKKLVVID